MLIFLLTSIVSPEKSPGNTVLEVAGRKDMYLQPEGRARRHAKAEEAILEPLWSFHLQGIKTLPSSFLKLAAGSERQQPVILYFQRIWLQINKGWTQLPEVSTLVTVLRICQWSAWMNWLCLLLVCLSLPQVTSGVTSLLSPEKEIRARDCAD